MLKEPNKLEIEVTSETKVCPMIVLTCTLEGLVGVSNSSDPFISPIGRTRELIFQTSKHRPKEENIQWKMWTHRIQDSIPAVGELTSFKEVPKGGNNLVLRKPFASVYFQNVINLFGPIGTMFHPFCQNQFDLFQVRPNLLKHKGSQRHNMDAWPIWDNLYINRLFAAHGRGSTMYHRKSRLSALNATFLLENWRWHLDVMLKFKRSWTLKAATFSVMVMTSSSVSLSISQRGLFSITWIKEGKLMEGTKEGVL